MTQITLQKTKKIAVSQEELRALFTASAQLTDTIEDIIEDRLLYHKEFLSGIKKSLREAQSGKLISIRSLAELR